MAAPITRLRPKYVVVTVVFLFVVACVPLAVRILVPFWAPPALVFSIAFAALTFVLVLGRVLYSCYQWIELDGDTIRGRKLLTRRVNEWKVRDIVTVKGVGLKELGFRELPVSDENARWRFGYEIEFRGGAKLLLSRHELAGMDEFLVALADQIERERAAG